MSRVCPRPCGRLATAAIFISIGVVQIIAGLILLKSNYVYLLSAPNIWTAASNFAVGTLFGVSSSVWKSIRKESVQHATRRNVLASLTVSAILMNSTTAAILLLGEGNTLLSIHLENNSRHSSKTFGSEILAYAYATSVCSPIVCVVAATVYLSGICFRRSKRHSRNSQKKNVLETDSNAFNWVYEPGQPQPSHSLPKPDPEVLRRAASDTSSSSDESTSSSNFPIRSNSVSSIKDLNASLNLGVPKIGAHGGSMLPRLVRQNTTRPENYSSTCTSHGRNHVSFIDEYLTGTNKLKQTLKAGSPIKAHSSEYGNQRPARKFGIKKKDGIFVLNHGESRNEQYTAEWPKNPIKNPYRRLPVSDAVFNCAEIDAHGTFRDLDLSSPCGVLQDQVNMALMTKTAKTPHNVVANIHAEQSYENKLPSISDEIGTSSGTFERFTENLPSLKHTHLCRTSTETGLNSQIGLGLTEATSRTVRADMCEHSVVQKTNCVECSNASMHNSLANDSKVSSPFDQTDHNFVKRTNSLLGEVVPVRVNTTARRKMSSKLIPVSIPVVSNLKENMNDTTINDEKPSMDEVNKFNNSRMSGFSSFRDDMNAGRKMRHLSNGLGTHSEKHLDKRREQISPLELISEMPPEEYSPAHTSGYVSVIEDSSDHPKQDLLDSSILNHPFSSSESGSSKERNSPRKKFQDAQRNILGDERTTSRRDAVNDVMEQFMDENSSNKESIAELFYDFLYQKVVEQSKN